MKITIETCIYEPSHILCKLQLSDAQRAHVSEKVDTHERIEFFGEMSSYDEAKDMHTCAGWLSVGEAQCVMSFNLLDDCDLCFTLEKRGREKDDELDLWTLMDDPCEHMWIDFVPFVRELLG